MLYGLPTAVLLGLTAGLAQSLGKLSLDALVQREVPERIRTSAFARSETLLQLSWVTGGFLGIALPLVPRLGLGVVAGSSCCGCSWSCAPVTGGDGQSSSSSASARSSIAVRCATLGSG